MEEVETGGHVAVEKIRLGKAKIHLGAVEASGESEPDILALAHEVALGNGNVADDAFVAGIAGPEGQFAGRLFDNLDHQDHAIRRAALFSFHLHRLEEAERPQPLACKLDQQAIEGVALGKAELTPDDMILGADIADDVDPLDVDARAFIDDKDEIDGASRLVLDPPAS